MEINTHDSEVFVSTTENPEVSLSIYAAAGIGAALFGAGFLVAKLTGKKHTCPFSAHANNQSTSSADVFDDAE